MKNKTSIFERMQISDSYYILLKEMINTTIKIAPKICKYIYKYKFCKRFNFKALSNCMSTATP